MSKGYKGSKGSYASTNTCHKPSGMGSTSGPKEGSEKSMK